MITFSDNISRKPYLGSTEIAEVWLGNVLIYPDTPIDYSTQYLTFNILENGNIGFTMSTNTLQYSKNGGTTWSTAAADTNIPVSNGDKVLVKFTNPVLYKENDTFFTTNGICNFYTTCNFNVYGNIMSLLYGDNFANQTVLPVMQDNYGNTVNANHFLNLFYGCNKLISAENLVLPAILKEECYNGMFQGCSSLTTAPVLPATTLTTGCYSNMFSGCSSLNYIKAMFTTTPSATYTGNWVNGVAATGTFVKNINAAWDVSGVNGVPTGWTTQYDGEDTTRIITTFDVTSTSNNTRIYGVSTNTNVSDMWIDNVLQPSFVQDYTFGTLGEHNVRYGLTDNTTIVYRAFRSCTRLTSITIPSSVTTLGQDCFQGCTSLTKFNSSVDGECIIPSTVTTINDGVFNGCRFTKAIFQNNITALNPWVFYNCSTLTSVILPNNVTSIGESTFYGCSSLTTIGLTGSGASIELSNNVTSIGDSAFWGCSGLTSVTIPNSVTSIGNWAFLSCTNLTSVTLPNNITSLNLSTFNGCSSLTSVGTVGSGASVEIPNSVTSIGNNVFVNCTGLTTITIPNSVTSIGAYVFNRCTSLQSITILATTPPTLANANAFDNTNNCPIYVPAASVNTYKSTANWSNSSVKNRIQAIPNS